MEEPEIVIEIAYKYADGYSSKRIFDVCENCAKEAIEKLKKFKLSDKK